VDLVRPVVVLERQLRPAIGTEAAGGLVARAETRRLARQQAKLQRAHAEPGHERGAGGPPAHRAMTAGLVEWDAAHRVAHTAAIASALQHRSLLCHCTAASLTTAWRRRCAALDRRRDACPSPAGSGDCTPPGR